MRNIDSVLQSITDISSLSTDGHSFINDKSYNVIPGWNQFVKELYADARKSFIEWVKEGKPLEGASREVMRTSRAKFRKALEKCKRDEENIRKKRLAEKLKKKDYTEFWKDIHKAKINDKIIPTVIDGEYKENIIAKNFAEKYKSILDKESSNISSANSVDVKLEENKIGNLVNLFTAYDIRESIKCLKPSIGHDNIHSNHLVFAPDILLEILAKFFLSCVIHGYLPFDMIYGIINPVIKDFYGDLSNSDNYRPVTSSSVFLKLFEYCILR